MESQKTVVCISCYFKGNDFLTEMHELGNRVILITADNLKEKPWAREAIDEVYYMPEISTSVWNLDDLVQGFSHLMRATKVDAVIALDDYDVEKAALIRETFRIPGMGQTTHRYFRDKLAMRQQAKDTGINVPEFTAVFNDAEVQEFADKVSPPWVLKPRSEASATGITKLSSKEELLKTIDTLGKERHLYLLESFKPGKVFHVDSIIYNKDVKFTCCSEYLATPMEVSHEGGVFRTKTLDKSSENYKSLDAINQQVIKNFGLVNGATHSEFIKGDDGKFYFLETASRIGGAHIPEMITAATGINIWKEWAKVENALLHKSAYITPPVENKYGGLVIALAKEKNPNPEAFNCEELYQILPIDYHIGLIYASSNPEKIQNRLEEAASLITENILNILPPKSKPSA